MWHITRVDWDSESLYRYLDGGWEPFAVTHLLERETSIWLRRWVEKP